MSKPAPKREQFLKEYGHLLGQVQDTELARRAGYICSNTITTIRNQLRIPKAECGMSAFLAKNEKELFALHYRVLMDRHNVSQDVVYEARKIARDLPVNEVSFTLEAQPSDILDGALSLYKDTVEDVSLKPVSFWDKIDGWLGFSFFGKIFRTRSEV